MIKDKYVAYYDEEAEFQSFPTFEAAEEWLKEYDCQDGIAESTEEGKSYIAEITHRSSVEKTDFKENYCECDPVCNECTCDKSEEEWPYDSDWQWVGNVKYLPVVSSTEKLSEFISDEDRNQIAITQLQMEPLNTIAHVALLKLSALGLSTESKEIEQTTEATFSEKRYKCKMVVTYEPIDKEEPSMQLNKNNYQAWVKEYCKQYKDKIEVIIKPEELTSDHFFETYEHMTPEEAIQEDARACL
jgi:hypothetical protein